MLVSSSYKAACSRSGISRASFVTHAQKGGSRKQSRTRRTSSPGSETDQLISEYKAVKQTSVSNSLTSPTPSASSSSANGTTSSSSRPAAVTRSLVTPIEAGAAAKSKKGFGRKGKNAGNSRKPTPAPPASASAVLPAPTLSTSKASGGTSPVAAAAAAQPPQPTAPTAADTAAAATGSKAPAAPPPLKVAGTRHEGFESKLAPKPQETSTPDKPQPPAAAAAAATVITPPAPVAPVAPPAPAVPAPAPEPEAVEAAGVEVDRSGSPIAGRALLEDSLARLAAAGDDVGAAEVHVNGLAELLNDARSTLSALREDASQVGGEAENLVGIMTDLLVDLSGELGLVCDHLTSTRIDIGATHTQLEAAAAATSADVAAEKKLRQVATEGQMDKVTQQAERMAAAAAAAAAAEDKADAAAAAAAAADQKLLSLQSQLKAKEAELNVLTQQNEQLRDQRTLMQQQADATAAAHVKATASPSSSPTASTDAANLGPAVASSRLREVLMSQVECNMLLLDKLGSLAQTVVGLPGLDASDRVKLASTISQCVLAVGAVQIPEDMLAASDSQAHAQQEE